MALNQKQKQYLYTEVFKAAFHKQVNYHRSMSVEAPSEKEVWAKTNRQLAPVREGTPSKTTVPLIRGYVDNNFLYDDGVVITDGLSILMLTHGFTNQYPLPPLEVFNITDGKQTKLKPDEELEFEIAKSIKLMEIEQTFDRGRQDVAVRPIMSLNPDVFKHVLSVKEVYKLVKRIELMNKLNIQ